MIKFKNNSKRLEKEIEDLKEINPKLHHIIGFYNSFINMFYNGADTVITCILRSDLEQRKMCESVKIKYYKSVHSLWRGVDLRINLKDWQIEAVGILINNMFVYDKSRPEKKAFVRHNIGVGDHIHLQTL